MSAISLPTRRLGTSELHVTIVGLGGNTFGSPRVDQQETTRIVSAALDLGVNFIDTAINYGDGRSEKYLSNTLSKRRDDAIIATKFNLNDLGSTSVAERIQAHLETSLTRLRTDHIDLWQLHFSSPTTPPEELLTELDKHVRAGKIRAIGASNYSSWRLCQAAHVAKELGTATFVTVQNYYHLFARSSEPEVVPFCKEYNVSILPYHPLGGGFLTGKYELGKVPP